MIVVSAFVGVVGPAKHQQHQQAVCGGDDGRQSRGLGFAGKRTSTASALSMAEGDELSVSSFDDCQLLYIQYLCLPTSANPIATVARSLTYMY